MESRDPRADCRQCPRLAAFRAENKTKFPDFHNAPVPSFGPLSAPILIVGLAPGLKGANRTGRPFTGDTAGDLLYATLIKFGLARGLYGQSQEDGLDLIDCRITNAVRCVPPQNKVTADEMTACRPFLSAEIKAMKNLHTIVSLGLVSHNTVLKTLDITRSMFPFAHGARHRLTPEFRLVDSYHCSRYNTNTGRLTQAMFEDVFRTLI